MSQGSHAPLRLHLLLRDLEGPNLYATPCAEPDVFQMLFRCALVPAVIDHLGNTVVRSPKAPNHSWQIVSFSFSEKYRSLPPLLLYPPEIAPIPWIRRVWEDQFQVLGDAAVI